MNSANRLDYDYSYKSDAQPDVYELLDNAEAGLVKRALIRYLFTRNYERSIKMHTMMGSSIIRKIVMSTAGRAIPPGSGGNYRLDHRRSDLEAATNFAVNGSAYNEVVHTVAAAPNTVFLVNGMLDGRYGASAVINATGIGINLGLVALQRYNRARMMQRIDEELSQGESFDKEYTNYLGIDSRALANIQENNDPIQETLTAEYVQQS